MITFGRCLLTDRLRKADLTQQELSEMTGIAKSKISEYANDKKHMSFRTAKIIGTILNCHADELYEWRRIDR